MHHKTRLLIHITGHVQGVGFRPHAVRLAQRYHLTGFVYNQNSRVIIEAQGIPEQLELFLKHLAQEKPPLCTITSIHHQEIKILENEIDFYIKKSEHIGHATFIPVDTAMCEACIADIFNPDSRFYHYPFTNCTDCGPRYTLTHQLPYDRERTSLQNFKPCTACQSDYENAASRRYHAQTLVCPACGPTLSMPISGIAIAIQNDLIIAVKSIGGFQLICNARSERAIKNLRLRKQRDHKPFALMVPDLKNAETFAHINDLERELLISHERPIVLVDKKENELPENIAPGLNTLGVMLPYTPFHYLLFDALPEKYHTLIVTSANISNSPILFNNEEAEKQLENIADYIVTYNRDIVNGIDDSVVQVIQDKPRFLRRARGYAPYTIKLPHAIPSTLGLGGHLKNTICLTRDDEAFISHYLGDLDSRASLQFFERTLQHLMQFLAIQPERVAHDAHPDFYTTHYAQSLNLPYYPVQHHRAHLASLIAEQRIQGACLGLVLDGYGYGDTGDAWGGELFHVDHLNFNLIGHLRPFPILPGDASGKNTWMNAVAIFNAQHVEIPIHLFPHAYPKEFFIHQLTRASLSTRSCGRLFDAAAAVLKISHTNHYEGQAAMMLESLVTHPEIFQSGYTFDEKMLDFFPLITALKDAKTPIHGANLFHGTLADGLANWIIARAACYNVQQILLTGGCLQNKVLASLLTTQLRMAGLTPIMHQTVPTNDAGLSLGQAWIAGNFTSCV